MFRFNLLFLLACFTLFLAGCSSPTPEASPSAAPPANTTGTTSSNSAAPRRGLDSVEPGMAGVPKNLVR